MDNRNLRPDKNQNPGDNNNQNNGQGGKGPNRNGSRIFTFLLLGLVALFIYSMFDTYSGGALKQITYTEFVEMVENDRVLSVEATSRRYNIRLKEGEEGAEYTYVTGLVNDPELLGLLEEHGVNVDAEIPEDTMNYVYTFLTVILPLVLMFWLASTFLKRMGSGGGPFGIPKSNAKVYNEEKKTGVVFADVAGQEEAKESLQEVVDFLHNPKKYAEIGARLPKGALLVGPPGTGKTLLAKAVAGEANVPFISIAGSDFVEMYVGVGAKRVRELFEEANKQAPCIIFIDEIDAIGKSRDARYGGNDEREQTLNQLLAEMDGFDTSKGILILAATNRPEVLDKALLRPGRFDRRIIVDKPDLKGRKDILAVHAKDVHMDETVDLEAIALQTPGVVGSDLANMINEAAINAVKKGRKFVSQEDLMEAVETVIAGMEKKDRVMKEEERKVVAYHEIGHALVSALLPEARPIQKITIVPRTMGSLGYTMYTEEEEKFLESQAMYEAELKSLLAGRAAEQLIFGMSYSGAANDIERATKMARGMVTRLGMSDKFGLMALETVESQYLDGRSVLNCSEQTAAAVDEEVKKILKESYEQAYNLLDENRNILNRAADYLLEKENITGKEFMEIFNEEKGITEVDNIFEEEE